MPLSLFFCKLFFLGCYECWVGVVVTIRSDVTIFATVITVSRLWTCKWSFMRGARSSFAGLHGVTELTDMRSLGWSWLLTTRVGSSKGRQLLLYIGKLLCQLLRDSG